MTSKSGNPFEALKSSDDSGEEEREQKTGHKLPPLEIPAHHHPLQHVHCLWFTCKNSATKNSASFDQNLKLVGRFGSVEQFWSIYGHCVRPHDMKQHSDYHLFREGIKPMWEDEANSRGGKWIVRLRKGLASRCWENLVLAILGEQFLVGEEICGAVVSVRHMEDIISVWNRTAADTLTTGRIRDTLRRVLNLPLTTIMEYKTHNDSIRDNSSFRNTDLFVK